MFLVFRKDKIYAYLVSILTVVLLFYAASNINLISSKTVETSASSEKLLPIYKVKTEEKKVSLTMNCAWNADDIDKILEILEQNNVKIISKEEIKPIIKIVKNKFGDKFIEQFKLK